MGGLLWLWAIWPKVPTPPQGGGKGLGEWVVGWGFAVFTIVEISVWEDGSVLWYKKFARREFNQRRYFCSQGIYHWTIFLLK